MKRKLLLAVLTAGLFSMNSCTQSVLGTDEQELLVQKNESANKACSWYWQTQTGWVKLGTATKNFTVVSGKSAKVTLVNDNNSCGASNGYIKVYLPGYYSSEHPDGNVYLYPGETRTIDIGILSSSTYSVEVRGYNAFCTKVFAVSVGYCS